LAWATPSGGGRPLRVGVINIMPRVEDYEGYLARPLAEAPFSVLPVWIRLESHVYSSSDAEHIRRNYVTFDAALRVAPLDALVLTGAPVEELPFEQVHYWPELSEVLTACRREIATTLGLCWGGMALGKLLGLEKRIYRQKLFGVFEHRSLDSERGLLQGSDDRFWCAHSRHSGIADDDLRAAERAGQVRLLAHGEETGYSLFESSDGRFVAHLGHPEYEPSRLVHEWERDRGLGRGDVRPPRNFDPERPLHNWRSHRRQLFWRWLGVAAQARRDR
jgi:homoserine O-succinyltransferase/O-acetyltransferase